MNFIGLDLGGINSRASIFTQAGEERIHRSAFPERPSVVLLPLVRKERLLAGDTAISSERGLGRLWPPLSTATVRGWSSDSRPIDGGRILLADAWQCAATNQRWKELDWKPADDLPRITKPSPIDCLTAEASAITSRAFGENDKTPVVLSIPNQLPEEAQDALLRSLQPRSRLIWRSMATAMDWAAHHVAPITPQTRLAIVDIGFHGTEVSLCDFRREKSHGRIFQVPIRRPQAFRFIQINNLIPDGPSPFLGFNPNTTVFAEHWDEISTAIQSATDIVICGPLGQPMVPIFQGRASHLAHPTFDENAIARGAALFAYRIENNWPTYVDVLPSLELFTLSDTHEPKWLTLIPSDYEVPAGEDFTRTFPTPIFIERGTTRLASWLQRSGEKDFRKVVTDLPIPAGHDAKMDLHVTARPAGGFAQVRIVPPNNRLDIFGAGHSVLLNWHSMERVERDPKEQWPARELRFGWPTCGVLYGYRPLANAFLEAADKLDSVFKLTDTNRRIERLNELKVAAKETKSPRQAGFINEVGHAAPVNQLVCFGSDEESMYPQSKGDVQKDLLGSNPEHEQIRGVGRRLWKQLEWLNAQPRSHTRERNLLITVLGRMGAFAPEEFQNWVAESLVSNPTQDHLFAAGRVLRSQEHGQWLFEALQHKADSQNGSLNQYWLRMLVYVLYQRPDVMREVSRMNVLTVAKMSLDVFDGQVLNNKTKNLFMSSLRTLVLLLRARRYSWGRDFLLATRCPSDEQHLAKRFEDSLEYASLLRLSPASKVLVERAKEWLAFKSSTDEMPPIQTDDEIVEEDDE